MPISPNLIIAGRCYVTRTGQLWRVLSRKAGLVRYQAVATGAVEEMPERIFARAVEGEVPCR